MKVLLILVFVLILCSVNYIYDRFKDWQKVHARRERWFFEDTEKWLEKEIEKKEEAP